MGEEHVRRHIEVTFLCLLSVALAVGSSAVSAQEVREVKLVDDPWPPYSIGSPEAGMEGGVAVEIARELYRRMGIDARMAVYPFRRCLKMVEVGQADGLLLVMKNTEERPYLVYSDPVIEAEETFFYLPERLGDFSWDSPLDLKGRLIGVVDGYVYSKKFEDAVRTGDLKTESATDAASNFRKLAVGRIDLYLEDRLVGRFSVQTNPQWKDRISATDKSISSYPLYFGISKLSPLAQMLPDINRVLSDMKSDGTIGRFMHALD